MSGPDRSLSVCVQGLWHLGSVIAATAAAAGHRVVGIDEDEATIEALNAGRAPLFEPGLDDLIAQGRAVGRLSFERDLTAASFCDLLWVCIDTPVGEDDRPDVRAVVERIEAVLPCLKQGTVVLVSAQLPVGTIATLEQFARSHRPALDVVFACSPENLRLGQAIKAMTEAERFVIGTRNGAGRDVLERLFGPWGRLLEWMGVESAEMVKHALNAFLGTTIAFANEIAGICEVTGAQAAEVRRGLVTDSRIGPRAPLLPGGAFAGGTLARDLTTLARLGQQLSRPTTLISAVMTSNEDHKQWAYRRLVELLGPLSDRRIAIWGLTYKAGTSALRRSPAIELCRSLISAGTRVTVHDPVVDVLPDAIGGAALGATPLDAARDADALVVCTAWPVYRAIGADDLVAVMAKPILLDPNQALSDGLASDSRVRHIAVGKP
jgi:UDPglucose 6-dehydrogenase